jgi:hypothetical protein
MRRRLCGSAQSRLRGRGRSFFAATDWERGAHLKETTMNLFRTAIAAAALASAALVANTASAFERWVYVVNEGYSSIYSVHITHVDDSGWGRDLLGSYLIRAGEEMLVEPDYHDGYCLFDVKITYETGRELILWDVNLCEALTIYTDGNYGDVEYI